MRKVLRLLFLCPFGVHRSALTIRLGYEPRFPVRCDDCGTFYQFRRPTTPEAK